MRLTGLRFLLFWAIAVVITGSIAGCDNPFDPLQKSDKIEGLSHFDFTSTQEHWDSDPEFDGLLITPSYYNEFHEQLNFHDKSHKMDIEIWTLAAGDADSLPARGSLLHTETITYVNSDDIIRVPIEAYSSSLSIDPSSKDAIPGCVVLRIHPPQDYPQPELFYVQCEGVDLYSPEPSAQE